MAKKYRVELLRAGCIECGACAKMCPDFFTMTQTEDMKADLIDSKPTVSQTGVIIKQVRETDDLNFLREAYECCPVTVIKLFDNTNAPFAKMKVFNTPEEEEKNAKWKMVLDPFAKE